MARKNLGKFKVSPTLQVTIQQNEKTSFYKRIEKKVVDMTNSCFFMLIASAAICYGIGVTVGWYIKKSTIPKKKVSKVKNDAKKRTSPNKYGMK